MNLRLVLAAFMLLHLCQFGAPVMCPADGKVAVLREIVEQVLRRGGAEVSSETVTATSGRLGSLVGKYGDDAVEAFRRVGPSALDLAEQAGPNAGDAIRMLAKNGDSAVWIVSRPKAMAIFIRHGDDASTAMMRHGDIAVELMERHGIKAGRALSQISSANSRRLAMLDQGDFFRKHSRSHELLDVVTRYGDAAADFIWRHKGALAVASVLVAFLNDPEPFIHGGRDLAAAVPDAITASGLKGILSLLAGVMVAWVAILFVGRWISPFALVPLLMRTFFRRPATVRKGDQEVDCRK